MVEKRMLVFNLQVALVLMTIGLSQQQILVSKQCLPATGNDEFTVVFRLNPNGNSAVTGIKAYEASEGPTYTTESTDSQCASTTLSEDAYGIKFNVDVQNTGADHCGMSGSNPYNFAIRAEGTNEFYTLSCNTGSLDTDVASTVSDTTYATIPLDNYLHMRNNPLGVTFDVVQADGTYAPTDTVRSGQHVQLRLAYNRGLQEFGADNWGDVFHTGFLDSTNAQEMVLEITTRGLGTRVRVTSPVGPFDQSFPVKRGTAAIVTLPSDFLTASNSDNNDWNVDNRGVKIEGLDDDIGVKVITRTSNGEDSFVALPDKLLGKEHLLGTGFKNMNNGQVIVVGTVDSTTVRINFNNFNRPGSFQINGQNVPNGVGTTNFDVTINENDILRIICGNDCEGLSLDATTSQNVAVIGGHSPTSGLTNNGIVTLQITPFNKLGRKYVFVYPPVTLGTREYNLGAATDADGLEAFNVMREFGSPGTAEAKEYSIPVQAFQYVNGDQGSYEPSVVAYPSMSQWGIHQYFYATEGYSYHIIIVTTIGDTSGISVTSSDVTIGFTDSTLGTETGFASKLTTVTPVSGSATHEMYYNPTSFTVTDTNQFQESGLIEFKSSSLIKPFMLLVYEVSGDTVNVIVPYGQRYPDLPGGSPTTFTLGGGGETYGTSVDNAQGNMMDDDRDFLVDEELLNGKDDDGDGRIDEDLTLAENIDKFAIYVTDLIVANNPTFTGSEVLHSSGCNSRTMSPWSIIKPFKHNTAVSSVFSNYWVLDTPKFPAFLPSVVLTSTDTGKAYFRVTFGFCTGDVSAADNVCQDSCPSDGLRRKRSTEELHTMDLELTVTGNTTRTEQSPASRHPCVFNSMFWVPSSLILLMILVESICVGAIVYHRLKM